MKYIEIYILHDEFFSSKKKDFVFIITAAKLLELNV
jgi:hypothetical protein